MRAVEVTGQIDAHHQIQAQVPADLRQGPVRLIVLIPDEDEAGAAWMQGIAREWTEELSNAQEDIYTLDDGQPINATR